MYLEGYAAIFGVIDKKKDLLKENSLVLSQNSINVFSEHNYSKPIGDVVYWKIDQKGLFVKIKAKDVTDFFRKKYLSIGFIVKESFYERGIRIIKQAEVVEVSVVNNPCNELTTIDVIYF